MHYGFICNSNQSNRISSSPHLKHTTVVDDVVVTRKAEKTKNGSADFRGGFSPPHHGIKNILYLCRYEFRKFT